MQAFQLSETGISHLHAVTLADPHPAFDEVVVRQRAASLNFIDLAVASGAYPGVALPIVPVADASGEVVEVGAGVTDWSVGDRALPHFKAAWIAGPVGASVNDEMRGVTRPGALSEYTVARASSLVRVPDYLTDPQAATLPIAATTAWNALRTAQVGPGSSVLLLGTGGVSIIALQLAKAAGARVLITSSSDAKLERAKRLGADELINYKRHPDWDAEVLRLTDGRGVQLVIESGGPATFNKSIAATAFGGTVFAIGILTGVKLELDILPVIVKAIRIQGNNTGSVADLASAARAIAAHRIEPVVDRVFAWTDAAEAYRYVESGAHFGKVGIAVGA